MAKLERIYNMSDPALCEFTTTLVSSMTRDEAEFIVRGVTVLNRQAMETLGNAFEVFPPDEAYLGQLMINVANRDEHRLLLTSQIQLISGFFEQMWGLNSGNYKLLNISNLQKKTDAAFKSACESVILQATNNLTALSPIGLTQAMIDTLTDDTQTYENLKNAVFDAKKLRDDKKEERIRKGNELYLLVAKYCKIGQLIFENISEARKNDYIIYKTYHPQPGKVTGLVYTMSSATLTWNGVSDAVNYEVAYAPDMPEPIFINIYNGPERSVFYNPGGPDNYLFRVRGISEYSIYGEWSDVLVVPR